MLFLFQSEGGARGHCGEEPDCSRWKISDSTRDCQSCRTTSHQKWIGDEGGAWRGQPCWIHRADFGLSGPESSGRAALTSPVWWEQHLTGWFAFISVIWDHRSHYDPFHSKEFSKPTQIRFLVWGLVKWWWMCVQVWQAMLRWQKQTWLRSYHCAAVVWRPPTVVEACLRWIRCAWPWKAQMEWWRWSELIKTLFISIFLSSVCELTTRKKFWQTNTFHIMELS